MIRLNKKQIEDKTKFIEDYFTSNNAADGSKMDANANVTSKNIATLEAELNKDINIQVNRELVRSRIGKLWGDGMAEEYIRQIEAHEIYIHDETSLKPYCASVTLYPFLLDGLTSLGGESKAPQHLASFCGSFVNLVFAISSQFAGAVATVEFLAYFDHFARIEYGDDYLNTNTKQVENELQHVIYAINQPAAARGYQSVFWNISLYDQYYFDSMFGDFLFPDPKDPDDPLKCTPSNWESVDKLQAFFLSWINEERKKAVLTFPIITVAMLTKDGKCKDDEFADMCAKELSEGNSFFTYLSDSPDSLASCCRLRNEIIDNTFSYTLGAGGVSTGSINVITINMNRLVQDGRDLVTEVEKVHMYHMAYRDLIKEYLKHGMLPVYDAGYISLEKQFLTIGINGLVEAAEFMGIEVGANDEYNEFVESQLRPIFDANKRATADHEGCRFNTEFVPAENLGPKNAKWDQLDGYAVPRDCYNSYFYPVEDEGINHMDKLLMHGESYVKHLDGGSALHLNLEEYLTQEGFKKLLNAAATTGCQYFCTNVKITICNNPECQHISKRTAYECEVCHTDDVDHGTRIIGYLKRISSFSKERQAEHARRHYHTTKAA